MTRLYDLGLCLYCARYVPRLSADGSKQARTTTKLCVLVVDDDPHAVASVARLLKSFCQVVTARSAKEALDKIGHVLVDVVLSDYHMDGEDGLWLLREVQRHYPWVRRVLGSADEITNTKALIR